MKASLLFVFTVFTLYSVVTAQKPGDNYVFLSDFVNVVPYNTFTNQIDNSSNANYQARRGQVFSISKAVTIDGKSGYYFSFWPFKRDGTQREPFVKGNETATYYIDSANSTNRIFFIAQDDLSKLATAYVTNGVFAAVNGVVLPVKLRFRNKQPNGDFSFEQSISLGGAVSYTHRMGGPLSTSSWIVLGGLGVTNVSVDSNTAPKAVTSKTTELGVTPFLGFTFSYKGVDISAVSGIDLLSGKAGQTWVYRNSAWLGLAIGVSIFKSNTTKASQTDTQVRAKSK